MTSSANTTSTTLGQMKLLGASVFARYRDQSGQPGDFPEDGYHGAYISALAERLKPRLDAEGGLSPEQLEARAGHWPIRNCWH